MLPKRNTAALIIIMGIMVFLFSYFWGLHYSRVSAILKGETMPYQNEYKYIAGTSLNNVISMTLTTFNIMGMAPFHLRGADPVGAFIPAGAMLGVMIFIGFGLDLKRRTSTSSAPGIEMGSAKWNTDIKGYTRKFTTHEKKFWFF